MPEYEGGCHCGRVRLRISPPAPIEFLLDCNCTICAKKGILHIGLDPDQLTVLQGQEDIETYRFHSRIAEHSFCRHCGIHVYTRPRNNPARRTVNARCLDDFANILAETPLRAFDGQNHPKDLPAP